MRKYLGESVAWVRLTMMFILMTLLCLGPKSTAAQTDPSANTMVRDANYGALPLVFIPNQGQFDSKVAYAIQGRDKSIYFTAEGLTFVLSEQVTASTASAPRKLREIGPQEPRPQTPQQRWTVKLDFVDANPEVRPESLEQAETLISYFKGRPEEWRTGLQASAKIIYRDLWPGIDLIYSGTVNRLKYDFIVHPGADPARIRLACRGADSLRVTSSGQLEVTTPLGTLQDEMPVAWQEQEGKRENVVVSYALNEPAGIQLAAHSGGAGRSAINMGVDPREQVQVYGFNVGDYDRTRTLVLDPEMLVYCGFLGGNGHDYGQAIAIDNVGNAFVTGYTSSTQASFPDTVGPDLTHNGIYDAFVAKVRADGTGLIYCGYIGGSGSDYCYGIAVDSSGNAYVTGFTNSTHATFPVTVGPDLTHNGDYDAFVAKVRADGTGLIYCGYIGGSDIDRGLDIAVDSSGNAFVVGGTHNSQTTFPVKVGPDLTHNGYIDAFVAKVSPGGLLLYCGYIGGSGDDHGWGIAVDSWGIAYITGESSSSQSTFPEMAGPDLTQNGDYDAFVAKVRADGTGLIYCGYIGGSNYDTGDDIALDTSGNAYVTGHTLSDQATFPVTIGPDLTFNGGSDKFIAKVRTDGTGLTYCGYIGGAEYEEYMTGIAVDNKGNAYVTGGTRSTQATFPVTVGPDLTHNGFIDAFVVKVKADGTGLTSCGYIGGSDFDQGYGIAVDNAGNIFVVGVTTSSQFSFPILLGPFLSHNGGNKAFIAKISDVAEGTDYFPWELFLPGILQGAKK